MNKKSNKKNFKDVLDKYIFHIIFGIFVLVTIVVLYEYFFKYADVIKNPQMIKDTILSYGVFSGVIYVLLQVVQVVFFFIPGEPIQVVGGYIFGTVFGTILSMIGIAIGSGIGYLIARYLMRDQVQKMIEKKDLKLFRKILTKGSDKIVIFFVYIIPGIPKDVLVYLCGVSDVAFMDFMLYSTLGRFPWILISAIFGNGIVDKNYTTLIVTTVVAITFFILGVLKGKDILKRFHERKNKKINKL